jgi:hypothetical protein
MLGRLGPGGRNLAELPITVDAAGQHLLAYGYLSSPRVTMLDLTTGRSPRRRGSTHDRRLVSRPAYGGTLHEVIAPAQHASAHHQHPS